MLFITRCVAPDVYKGIVLLCQQPFVNGIVHVVGHEIERQIYFMIQDTIREAFGRPTYGGALYGRKDCANYRHS